MRAFGLRFHRAPDQDRGRYLRQELSDISRRLRSHLVTSEVLATTVREIRRCLDLERATIWLTTGDNEVRRAVSDPPGIAAEEPPPGVLAAARRRRTTSQTSRGTVTLAVPLVAPRSGLIGILDLSGARFGPAEESFAGAMAAEAAMAVETANLYEQAVAAKERSEAVLSRIADAIVVTDSRGRILECNEAAAGMTGGRPEGQRCADALGLRSGERALDCSKGCALLALGRTGAQTTGHEVWRERPDGRRQPLLADVAIVTDHSGAPSEVVHSFRDVTRLKEADEAKSLFLATASHELKTPLTVIQGFARLLGDVRFGDAEERTEATVAIQRRAAQLNKIVDRLLLSSRIEAGRIDVAVAPIDVVPILEERVAALRVATGRTIEFRSRAGPPAVLADPDAIATVADHLLDNAVKYSPGGEPVLLDVTVEESSVEIAVTDGGIGMDAEQVTHCFEKFWQAESSDVRRFGGTGIGLYIVQSLVEAMGGTIRVESYPLKGSTFDVSLRRADAQAVPPARPAAAHLLPPEPSVIREFMRQIGIPQARSQP